MPESIGREFQATSDFRVIWLADGDGHCAVRITWHRRVMKIFLLQDDAFLLNVHLA